MTGETYNRVADHYCPHCGDPRFMWVEDDPGDYYLGSRYFCTQCKYTFHLDLQEPSTQLDNTMHILSNILPTTTTITI